MSGVFTFLMFALSGAMAKHSWTEGKDFDAVTFTVCAAMFLGHSVYVMWADRPERWRHRKRGSVYEIVAAQALVQTEAPLLDNEIVTVYRDVKTGVYAVRPPEEFMDGRFEKL